MTMTVPTGFARLLATENIVVRVDASAVTASFDVANRVLTMPNWECSDRLRDMLIGHEVAHALFTTGDVPTMVERVGSDFAIAKDYLNVCEDVRIDRLIQRKYAGLRRDYAVGYREMIEKDFFGVNGGDPNEMPLIDRINCHFKHFEGIQFTAEEQAFVDRLEKIETMDEMIEVARDIYEFAAEKAKMEQDLEDGNPMGAAGGDESDEDGMSDADGGETDADGDSGDAGTSDAPEGEETDGEGSTGAPDGSEDGDADTNDSLTSGVGEQATKAAPSPAKSMTYERSQSAIAETVAGDDHYGIQSYTMPETDIEKAIMTYSEILDSLSDEMNLGFDEFKRNARHSVNNLAMLFERKKAAAVANRTQVAKTGRLDMTALHKYKMTEDIFLRNRIEAKGKNHGMIMYVDWSGSMADCIDETIQQTILLAMFCKKVGIPFRVYAFSTHRRNNDFDNPEGAVFKTIDEGATGMSNWNIHSFTLLELFSDRMKTAEFEKMAGCLLTFFNHNDDWYHRVPRWMGLGGTPLNEAIFAGIPIAKKFRAENRIDVLNTIFLTDGVGGNPFNYYSSGDYVINDRETGRVWSGIRGNTDTILRIYKDLVGGNLIGFFLDSKRDIEKAFTYGRSYYGTAVKGQTLDTFKKNRFAQFMHEGYDTYYVMDKNVAVYAGTEKMDALPENASVTKAINAFKKDLGNRNASRPLLSDFTDRIAKEMV